MMLPIKYGDKAAIAIGGYARYSAQRKAGMSHKEAAKTLGCAETTVSWRIYKAKGKLKKLLKSEVDNGTE